MTQELIRQLFNTARNADSLQSFERVAAEILSASIADTAGASEADILYQTKVDLRHQAELADAKKEHYALGFTDGKNSILNAPTKVENTDTAGAKFEDWIESIPALKWESWGRREAAHAAWLAATPAPSVAGAAQTDHAALIAETLHWPEHWDTAAYPDVWSALQEVMHSFQCSECRIEPVADTAVAKPYSRTDAMKRIRESEVEHQRFRDWQNVFINENGHPPEVVDAWQAAIAANPASSVADAAELARRSLFYLEGNLPDGPTDQREFEKHKALLRAMAERSSVADAASDRNALFGRVTDWVNEHRIPFDAQNDLFRILSAAVETSGEDWIEDRSKEEAAQIGYSK